MKLTLLIVLGLTVLSCQKKKEPQLDTETPLDSIIPQEHQVLLKSLSRFSPQAEKNLVRLMKEGDEVVRTIALRRIGNWSRGKGLTVLSERFHKDLSPRVRRTALDMIWQMPETPGNLMKIRIESGLKAINDADDTVFELGFSLMTNALLTQYRTDLKRAIERAPKKRQERMLRLFCKAQLDRSDYVFLKKWGNDKGFLPQYCVDKVLSHYKKPQI
ncbi:hypothetical protein KKF84_02525 [Myxococcota bacterium]|nr:hypothetical protein [Myxococcota bacterium]